MDPCDIDKEHEILFALLQKLRACETTNSSDVNIDHVLRYACDHFAHEESLMGVLPANIRDAHCQAHEMIASKLAEMKVANLHQSQFSSQLIRVVELWMDQHIEIHDSILIAYLNNTAPSALLVEHQGSVSQETGE